MGSQERTLAIMFNEAKFEEKSFRGRLSTQQTLNVVALDRALEISNQNNICQAGLIITLVR